ncbi:MAG TPA: hypothetical protein VFQ53_27770 [Kofleriaceae bacterium]|nr:hypothetical protein [Kofleriaceae bacterium]
MVTAWRRVALPGRTSGFYERPVAAGATLAVSVSAEEAEPGAVPVVAVLDIDGSPAFTLSYDRAGRDVETSEPCVDADGTVRAAVYEHDVELVVVGATRDGALLPRTSLGSEYPLHASDSGPKLGTYIAATSDGGFVVSYHYRQVRNYFVGKYRDGAPAALWHLPELLVGVAREHLVTYTAPDRASRYRDFEIVGRTLDGVKRWELPGDERFVAGTTSDAVLVIDRSARAREVSEYQLRAQEAFISEYASEADVDAADRYLPAAPTRVAWLDVATGVPRWEANVAGDVLAAHATERMVAVITNHAIVSWAGGVATTTPIAGIVYDRWPPSRTLPVIVGDHDGAVVWADDAGLHVEGSTIELPCTIDGFHPNTRERALTKPNAIVAAGHVYVRDRDALWIHEL